jgi:hypothetical protein
MKRILTRAAFAAFAAAFALRAGAVTATKAYVDGRDAAIMAAFDAATNVLRAATFPAVPLSEEQATNGVSYVDGDGIDQDAAIAIGPNAKASVDPAYVAKAQKNVTLRSVSVAVGGYADAQVANSPKSQAIAIGWFAQAKASQAIAIGAGAQHANETALSGDATVALADRTVAVGYKAKATASGAWQFGAGTNDVKNSLKFGDTYIVKDGRLAASTSVKTNDVRGIAASVVEELLAPQTLRDWTDCVVTAKTHTITTLAPTNAVDDELEIEPGASRNYEVYLPNTAEWRESLPVSFSVADTNLTRLGAAWSGKVTRLPALVKVREPQKDVVLLDAETYDDGWDWTPVVTNVVWETGTNGLWQLQKVEGYNLQGVTSVKARSVRLSVVTNEFAEESGGQMGLDGHAATSDEIVEQWTTNEVRSTRIANALYRSVWPVIEGVSAGADGQMPEVEVEAK